MLTLHCMLHKVPNFIFCRLFKLSSFVIHYFSLVDVPEKRKIKKTEISFAMSVRPYLITVSNF